MTISIASIYAAAVLTIALASQSAVAQVPQKQQIKPTESTDKMIIKVYNVVDLVVTAPNYPYRGGAASGFGWTLSEGQAAGGLGGFGGGQSGASPKGSGGTSGAGMGGLSGGGMASGGLGMGMGSGRGGYRAGAGVAAIAPGSDDGARFDLATLRRVLVETIEPQSWMETGGNAQCTSLGGMLVIRQTAAGHEKIQAFLEEIRSEGGSLRPVTVRAYWLFLDSKQLAELTPRPTKDGKSVGRRVDPDVLDRLAAEPRNYQGQVTCFDGQTVHIVSGRDRTAVTSLVPVVAAGAVAYDPQVSTIHDGAVLQVTPGLIGRATAATLDIQSLVTQAGAGTPIEIPGHANPDEAGSKPVGVLPRMAAQLDRMNFLVQRLATTLRVPLGQPVLVGGMTFEPNREDGSSPQLYLVVEVTVADGQEEPHGVLVPMPSTSGTRQAPAKK